jgi:hypothetical protein
MFSVATATSILQEKQSEEKKLYHPQRHVTLVAGRVDRSTCAIAPRQYLLPRCWS